VTGAGRGIGFEAARSLAWLGARVVLAEISTPIGEQSAQKISAEMGQGAAKFVQTDVADETSVNHLAKVVLDDHGRADVVLNNACVFTIGSVKDTAIQEWDRGYAVNLRGPVLMAKAFLPQMLEANSGVFVNVSSSGAAPYLGAYESFKTAQVELANTLDAELEDTGVICFTIGPGLVRTPGSAEGIGKLAPLYGKTVEEFYAMSAQAVIPVEEAGAGFAAAIAMADRYRGKETSSIAALIDAGIPVPGQEAKPQASGVGLDAAELTEALHEVREALASQNADWKKYSVFFRQWMFRDFKKNAGMPMDEWLGELERVEKGIQGGKTDAIIAAKPKLEQLCAFYDHLVEAQRGYQKDPAKLEEGLVAIRGWQDPVKRLLNLLSTSAEQALGEKPA